MQIPVKMQEEKNTYGCNFSPLHIRKIGSAAESKASQEAAQKTATGNLKEP
jgi:hypothetical protein